MLYITFLKLKVLKSILIIRMIQHHRFDPLSFSLLWGHCHCCPASPLLPSTPHYTGIHVEWVKRKKSTQRIKHCHTFQSLRSWGIPWATKGEHFEASFLLRSRAYSEQLFMQFVNHWVSYGFISLFGASHFFSLPQLSLSLCLKHLTLTHSSFLSLLSIRGF